jgi:hypothetical protein
MHDPSFLSAHRIHLDRHIAIERLLGSPIRPRGEYLTAPLAVAGRIEHNPLAVAQATKCGLEAKKLERIDRLATFSDQKPEVILPGNDGLDPLIILTNLNLTIKVKLVENTLD